ncbi:MAG: hypothetical protein RLZZ195_116 [Pseudomonadota bacterium]
MQEFIVLYTTHFEVRETIKIMYYKMNFNKNKFFNYFRLALIIFVFMLLYQQTPTVYSDILIDNQILFQDPATWAMSEIIDLHHDNISNMQEFIVLYTHFKARENNKDSVL